MRKALFLAVTVIVLGVTLPTFATPAKSPLMQFTAEVWADNWFALYINGKKVGEDSVPITTERSFNSETIKFSAKYPLTIGIIAKDYVENESGLEYIGKPNQQIGDGGLAIQVRETASNRIVATSNSTWKVLVTYAAPMNPECVRSPDPLTECRSQASPTPKNWSTQTFLDGKWGKATTYTPEEVGVKEGYFDIAWSPKAKLIWSTDLKVDNTILFRKVILK